MNKNKLIAKMKEYGDRQEDLAKYIGISLTQFSAKINGKSKVGFRQNEIRLIKKRYNLTSEEIDAIFFCR